MTVNEALEAVINQKPVTGKVRVSLDYCVFHYKYINEVVFRKGKDGKLECYAHVLSSVANSATMIPVEDVEYWYKT